MQKEDKDIFEVKIPPEKITDNSPLIKSDFCLKPITRNWISRLIHHLLLKAELIKPGSARRYQYRGHSLRKFFKTQLEALGLKTDYIEYMMGHKISTYHDIAGINIETLRNIYTSSGLSIRPKAQPSKRDMIKLLRDIIKSKGENPEEYLKTGAEPHRIVVNDEMAELRNDLAEFIRTEVNKNNFY